jgi:hypothetical protein
MIKDEGVEAGCQWEVTLENTQDPGNSQILNMPLDRLAFQAIDLRKLDDGYEWIPKADDNPIRQSSTAIENFDAAEKDRLAESMDLWKAIEPDSFARDFDGSVNRLKYRNDSKACAQSAGFADDIGESVITLCDAPDDSGAIPKKSLSDPFGALLRAQLIAHESRHIKGWKHDWLTEDYRPCEGTAASAVLPFSLVASCTSAFCPMLRDAAFHLFLHELHSSVKGDGRRFQGQCKRWSDKMGLSMADIQNEN